MPKKSTGSRYPEEFKAEAVQLARSHPQKSIRQLARELGISDQTLHKTGLSRHRSTVENARSSPPKSARSYVTSGTNPKRRAGDPEKSRSLLRKERRDSVSAFRLIEAERARHCVPKLCCVLGVSRSGYYAWRSRPTSERARFDTVLSEKIETIHRNSRATYGAPRIHAELKVLLGIRCGKKRVARLMHRASLRGCLRGRRMRTAHRRALQQAAPDLVNRHFAAEEPDRLWVADITYVRSREGFVYLTFILDAYSRRIVGWSMATHLRTELVVDALQMAIARRKPSPGLVHHPDRGVQYTSLSFGKHLENEGLLPSMGRVGSAHENALAETFVATLKTELLYSNSWPTRQIWRGPLSSGTSRASITTGGGTPL